MFEMNQVHSEIVEKSTSVSSATDGMDAAAAGDSGSEVPSLAIPQTNGAKRKRTQEQAATAPNQDDDDASCLSKSAAGASASSSELVVRERK